MLARQSTLWLLAGSGRFLTAVVFGLAVLSPELRPWTSATVILLVLCLGTGAVGAWRIGLPAWAAVWLNDVIALALLTPLLVLSSFAASGAPPLEAAAWLAYLELLVPAMGTLLIVVVVAKQLARRLLPGGDTLLLLPTALQVLALTTIVGAYQVERVFGVLSTTYFLAAAVTGLFPLVTPRWRTWLPLVTFAGFVVILSATGAGIFALVRVEAPIALASLVLILITTVALGRTPARSWSGIARSGAKSATEEEPRSPSSGGRRPARRRPRLRHPDPDTRKVTSEEIGVARSRAPRSLHGSGQFPFN